KGRGFDVSKARTASISLTLIGRIRRRPRAARRQATLNYALSQLGSQTMADDIRRCGRVAAHYFGQEGSRPAAIAVIALAEAKPNLKFRGDGLRRHPASEIEVAGRRAHSRCVCSMLADLWTNQRVQAGCLGLERWGGGISHRLKGYTHSARPF